MALIRLYEELNDYMAEDLRKQDIDISEYGICTVRSILLSFHVPLEAVDLILVNSRSEGIDYVIQTNDRISVYPEFERFNIESVTRIGPRPLRRPKFITDTGLKELAHQMNARGMDVVWLNSDGEEELIQRSNREKRTILTLNREVAEKAAVNRAIILTTRTTDAQIEEIRQILDL